MQSIFQYAEKTKSLPATTNNGPTFGVFSIIKEALANHIEIDRNNPHTGISEVESALLAEENNIISDEESNKTGPNNCGVRDDNIQDIYMNGLNIIHKKLLLSADQLWSAKILPGPLNGYDYAPFKPNSIWPMLAGHLHASPTQAEALAVLKDLGPHIQPKRQTNARKEL